MEKEMPTDSSILAWKIPGTEEPSRLQSIGLQRVGYDWAWMHFQSKEQIPGRGMKIPRATRWGPKN